MKRNRKRRATRLAFIYLSAAVIALGVFAGTQYERAQTWQRQAANQYQHAFNELVTAMGEMDAALQKSVYATTPSMVNAVCTEVFGKAMTAQMSLGVLPFHGEELERTSGFISRVGDYAFSLSRAAAGGSGYSPEALEALRGLSETAGVLADNLKEMQSELQDGRARMDELDAAAHALLLAEDEAVPALGDSMRLIEREFPEVPSLIYDGPFSEHLTGMQPRALEGAESVDAEAARDAAARFLGVPRARVYPTGDCKGDIPCYGFATDAPGGGTVFVSVTKQGARLLAMLSSRPVARAVVSDDDAVAAAETYLQSIGFEDMAETYHMKQGGILTVNYAYRQGDVLCYSDLVKVSVALDSGKVCGFEGRGYLSAHCVRVLPDPAVSADAARAAVPEELEVLSTQLTLVPSDGMYETLCHEFKCAASDGRHYIIYVDALTGAQHKILILLEDESGTLTL